jgi:pimeloyl-ACP methyl ester carboxylesterase
MQRDDVRVPVEGGDLVGWVAGEGPPVLLLHGGPALDVAILDPLVAELVPGYRVAWYQQRGLSPSTEEGPHGVDQHVRDIESVLDSLGWDRALVVGHSWGGFLVVAAAAELGDRMRGAMAIDPLGAADQSTWPQFGESLEASIRPDDRPRYDQLNAIPDEDVTPAEALDMLRFVWSGYFADPSQAPAMPDTRIGLEAHLATWSSITEVQPELATRLPRIEVPFVFVHGGGSPMPVIESSAAVDLLPDGELEVVEGAGHFIWYERPGAVRAALDRLAARTSG